MTTRALMIVGSMSAAVALFITLAGGIPTAGTIVMVFASGALFGKGYGVWEERSRRKDQAE